MSSRMHRPGLPIALLLFLVGMGPLQAQEYSFSHLDIQDGLASNQVHAITQDQDGFWWFGTNNGLQRFDGKTFRTFRHITGDSTSLIHDIVSGLFSDSHNRLWVGTDQGLCRFDRVKEAFLPALTTEGKLAAEFTGGSYRFLEDSFGDLWVAVPNSGLLRYLPHRDRWERIVTAEVLSGKPPLFAHLTEEPTTGNIWFGDRFKIGYYDRRNQRIIYSREQHEAHPVFPLITCAIALFIDRESNLWIIDGDSLKFDLRGILRYNLRSGACKRYAVGIFGSFYQDSRGRVWITTGNRSLGLAWFDQANDTFRFIQRRANDPYSIRYGWDGFQCFFEDREGNIWLGSAEGISVFNPYAQRFFAIADPLTGTEKWKSAGVDFLETRRGEIWVGTYFGGLYVLDQNFRLLRHIYYPPEKTALEEEMENFNAVWALYQSRSGDIWAGGQHGTLQRFSADGQYLGRWQAPELMRETIRCIFEDESGHLWLATQKGALVRLEVNSLRFTRYPLKPGCLIQQVTPAGNNRFWLSSGCRMVLQWDAGSATLIDSLAPVEQLSAGRRLLLDAGYHDHWNKDTFLISGVHSLYFFHSKTRKLSFPQELEALPSRNIAYFKILSPREVWISAETRLIRWSPQSRKITTFGPADGIRAETFSSQNKIKQLSGGRMLFSTSDRVYVFHPDRITERKPPPQVSITAVRTGKQSLDQEWLTSGRLELPFRQNFLTLEFAALSWLQRDKLSYECRLLGWEDQWQDYGAVRQASYSRLFPGRYTFQVRARNTDGLLSEKIRELSIRIRPPVWLSWWFITGMSLLLLFSARRLIRSHYRRKAELQQLEMAHRLVLEQERLRIARDMHDDLGSGISALGLQAEIARRRTRSLSAAAEFEKIADSAVDLGSRIRETVWLINSRNDTLDQLAGFLYQYAGELLENAGLEWQFNLPAEVPKRVVAGEHRRAVLLSFKEALNNALRHSGASRLEIDLRLQDQYLHLSIVDNGRGFDPDDARRKNGNGLRNMEERMAAAGGAFRIKSEEGGTMVCLELPLSAK